jgi:DNA topoisomerase IB
MIPKDLRTFRANTLFIDLIRDKIGSSKVDKKTAKEELKAAIEGVAEGLGNTPSVTKSAYLDSRMLDWYLSQRIEGLTNG